MTADMKIREIIDRKKAYLNLLLLADEQEDMIDRYLERGTMYTVLQVGTGDSPSTIPFYEACGFRRHHLVKNFFTDHYDHPIYECGVQLVDMVYLQREL